jgi:hypothetical protein
MEIRDFDKIENNLIIKKLDPKLFALIGSFLKEMRPLLFDENFKYRPIKLIQIGRLYKIAKATIEFILQIIKIQNGSSF